MIRVRKPAHGGLSLFRGAAQFHTFGQALGLRHQSQIPQNFVSNPPKELRPRHLITPPGRRNFLLPGLNLLNLLIFSRLSTYIFVRDISITHLGLESRPSKCYSFVHLLFNFYRRIHHLHCRRELKFEAIYSTTLPLKLIISTSNSSSL